MEEIKCNKCRHYDKDDNYCKALVCDGLSCDDPLPCEVEGETEWMTSE